MTLPKALLSLTALLSLSILPTAPALADAQPTAPIEKITINLSEMKFQVEGAADGAPVVLKAGQRYKLSFENLGSVQHEVLIGRGLTHNEEEHELDYEEHLLATTETLITGTVLVGDQKKIWYVEAPGFKELELDPGTRLSLLFTVPENVRGDWEIGCFAPGHHQAGMRLPLVVE